jgi:cell division protein FtsB
MIIRPSIIMIVAGIVIVLILFSLAQEMNRRWQIQRQVQHLEQEANDMQKHVVELENLNQYFRTDDYQERLAREKFNYHASGEKVVLIPDPATPSPGSSSAAATTSTTQSVPLRWWRIFFVDANPLEALQVGGNS